MLFDCEECEPADSVSDRRNGWSVGFSPCRVHALEEPLASRHVDCKESNMAAERATTLALPIWWAHCLHSLHRFFRMPCQQSRLPPHSLHLFFLRLCSQGRPPPWVCFALGIRAMFCPAERGAASPTTNACASTRSSVIGADSAADAPESVDREHSHVFELFARDRPTDLSHNPESGNCARSRCIQ
jgi:hypothetical protein